MRGHHGAWPHLREAESVFFRQRNLPVPETWEKTIAIGRDVFIKLTLRQNMLICFHVLMVLFVFFPKVMAVGIGAGFRCEMASNIDVLVFFA